jgi:hypothetical protein
MSATRAAASVDEQAGGERHVEGYSELPCRMERGLACQTGLRVPAPFCAELRDLGKLPKAISFNIRS